ncbi:MAG: hypothetical protein JSV43_09120 [Methanobacteriota archaeon]|nr:MAG: hypothetical protein JSV43_09120 [Euryarchaeota archaeon]
MRDPKNGSRSFFLAVILTLTLFLAVFAPLVSFPGVSAIIWGPIEETSEDKRIEYQRYPAIAADGGKVYAVWADNGDRDYDIFVREHDGAAWQLEKEVNTDDRDIDKFLPDIAADGGDVHVVWHDPINGDYDIMYRLNSGGFWGPVMELSSDVGLESQQNPVVAAVGGKVYVAWQDGRDGDWDIYFRYYDGFAWGSVQEVSIDVGSEAQSNPSIAAGGGLAYLVWEDAGDGDNDIMMRVFNGFFWGSIMEVSQDSASEIQNVPDVAYDIGTVHVVWEEFRTTDRDIYHRSWDGLIFSAIQEISVDSGTEFQDVPSVAAKFGKVHAVWADRGDGDWDIVYREYDGLSWLAPEEISIDAGNENQWLPDIAADVGAVHVVWEDQGDGDNDIFYRRGNESVVENEPPEILNVLLDGSSSQTYPLSSLPPTMTLTATVDDSATGNSTIGGANHTIGPGNWVTSTPMNPDDFLDTSTEGFHVTVVSPMFTGTWEYCVYGWDVALNYNVTGLCASLTITDDLPPIVTSVLIDGLPTKSIPIGAPSVTLTATINDRSRGDSVIGGANYTSPSQNWANSSLMTPDNALDTSFEGFHATIVTSSLGFGNYQICVYGWDILLNRNTTGACANLVVALETLPPITRDAIINGLPSVSYGISSVPPLLLIATVDDTTTGNSIIGGANYTIEPQNWSSSTPMIPNNALDTPMEWFHADLNSSFFDVGVGVYQICAYGWDNVPNFDDVGSCATLTIVDDIIPEIRNVTINGSSPLTIGQGTGSVQLNATMDDSGTGGSVIGGANYTWGAGNFPGTLMNVVNPPLDLDVEDFAFTVDTSSLIPGVYELCVYGWDMIPNNNYTGECVNLTVVPEIVPPMILNVLINGLSAASFEFLSVPILNLTATIDDSITGNTSVGGANYTVGRDNWPGIPMPPVDVFDTPTEEVYSLLSSPITTGTWEHCVYGWDTVPNLNTTGSCADLTIYDGTPPEALDVLVNGSTVLTISPGTPNVTLTATIDDSARGESIILGANYTSPSQDWSNSTNMTPDDWLDTPIEGFSALINTSALGLGSYDFCVYGRDEELNNDTVGACATVLVTGDFEPPVVSNVRLNGQVSLTLGLSELNGIILTANIDDRLTGNSTIMGANYSWVPPTWPGTSMAASDGIFDSPVENVSAIVTAIAQPGQQIIWVEGCDEYYNCGYGFAVLVVEDDLPPAVTNVSLDGVTTRTIPAGTPTVVLTANIDDTAMGNSTVGGANFTSPALAWGNSTAMVPRNPPLDSSLEEFNVTIDTYLLTAGTYEFWVYGWDDLYNFNSTPIIYATLVVEGEIPVDNPPIIDSLVVDPAQAEQDEEVEIVVEATDDNSVDGVWIEIVGPDDQIVGNVSADYNETDENYIAVLSYHDPGIYNVTAWVVDDGGNWASERESFEILEGEEEPEPVVMQPNLKPVLAIVFLLLLLLFGSEVARRRTKEGRIRRFWFLPFALAELATCAISAISGLLSIPPVMGVGLAVDLTILILGMSMPMLLLLRRSSTIEEESEILDNGPEGGNDPENTK